MSQTSANPAQQNVKTVSRLERDALETRSPAERISDTLTKRSAAFLALHYTRCGLAPGF